MNLWVVLAAVAVLVAGYSLLGRRRGKQARHLVSTGATLVDVRTPEEFASGHIEGAINVPLQTLDRRLSDIPRDRPVVVYCRSGARSSTAAGVLRSAGYATVFNLGSIGFW